MAGEPGGRPLLPQTAQMQSYSFTPTTLAPRENQRNYVFVDEHNRHKRLKVMRACEGCRRRKIKCDAATTNHWPCAACIRLKLNCVPPQVSYEKDFTPAAHTFELDRSHDFAAAARNGADQYQPHHVIPQHISPDVGATLNQTAAVSFADGARMYPTAPYIEPPPQDALQYSAMPAPQVAAPELNYHPQPIYSAPPANPLPATESDGVWRTEVHSPNITDTLGELRIDHTAVAPYITNQKKTLAEAPAIEEVENIHLPPSSSEDHTVRIPREMMPSDTQALHYFEYFFTNIHPYVPVINKTYFYQQWQHNPNSISPLLLEGLFACSTLMLGEEQKGKEWLALAAKHEESFRDVPRLSTIQAVLLLLKAREASPKRGYFYRSWMTVVNLVAMAKDLELHEHYELHQLGKSCSSPQSDCTVKSRVWHTLFVLEVMIGGPQGRFDFGVKPETVDFTIPQPLPGQDDSETQVLRQFTYFMRIVKNIQLTTVLHGKLRKLKKDWAVDPEFAQHNQDFATWMRDLPREYQIAYPNDSSPPWISSHFVASLHCYHYLGLIMHHRPQIHFLSESYDASWKQHMSLCYSAAQCMCRLQEAILREFGLTGLFFMQRGVSFTIYSILTCTMLHLTAITSPDPDLNSDARDYFVRHMRILEQCMPSWPMPDLHAQFNALREAFSADTTKPFELKPTFPFGSPGAPSNPSPIGDGPYRTRGNGHDPSLEQPGQVNYSTHPITPPISASDSDPKADSPVVQSLVMMAAGQRQHPPSSLQIQEPVQWNPNRIFDQWNAAFGTPPPSTTSQSSPPLRPPPPGTTYEIRTPQDTHPPGFPQQSSVSPHAGQVSSLQTQLPPPVSYSAVSAPAASFVTPSMWQDVVASSFPDNLKRRWDYGGSQGVMDQGHMTKRSR